MRQRKRTPGMSLAPLRLGTPSRKGQTRREAGTQSHGSGKRPDGRATEEGETTWVRGLPGGRTLMSWRGCRSIVAVVLLCAALFVTAGLTLAQTPPSPGSAQSLTQTLTTLNAEYQAARSADRARIANRMLTVAATRQRVLASLMDSIPEEILQAALPAALRARLPVGITTHLEHDEQLEGTLEILHEDSPLGGRYRYFLRTTSGRYSLHFANRQATHLLTGSRIRVRGVQVGTTLALATDGAAVQTVVPAPVPNTLGEQRTLVML